MKKNSVNTKSCVLPDCFKTVLFNYQNKKQNEKPQNYLTVCSFGSDSKFSRGRVIPDNGNSLKSNFTVKILTLIGIFQKLAFEKFTEDEKKLLFWVTKLPSTSSADKNVSKWTPQNDLISWHFLFKRLFQSR